VRRVEPAAFTKVSALGIEEQRVNVLIDVTSPPEQWQSMGDGFRVVVDGDVDMAAESLLYGFRGAASTCEIIDNELVFTDLKGWEGVSKVGLSAGSRHWWVSPFVFNGCGRCCAQHLLPAAASGGASKGKGRGITRPTQAQRGRLGIPLARARGEAP